MTTEQIREMLQSPAYEFLRSNEHLKGKIIFSRWAAVTPTVQMLKPLMWISVVVP